MPLFILNDDLLLGNLSTKAIIYDFVVCQNQETRVISRNLKLGGIDKCLGEGWVYTCVKLKFTLKNIKKNREKKH